MDTSKSVTEDSPLFKDKNSIYEANALRIVATLSNELVNETLLLSYLNMLSPRHYDDIVEERVIINKCGYLTCSNNLTNVLTKKYMISTKSNKLYDITKRKNYCSDYCFEASMFLQKQIPNTPLWWRSKEIPCDFQFLSHDSKGMKGEEIDFGIAKVNFDENKSTVMKKNVPVVAAKTSKLKCQSRLKTIKEESSSYRDKLESESESDNEHSDNKVNDFVDENSDYSSYEDESCQDETTPHKSTSKIFKLKDERNKNLKQNALIESSPITNTKILNRPKNSIDKVEHVEKSFKEWFSLETVMEILHEDIIKNKFSETIVSKYNELKTNQNQDKMYQKIQSICKKLNLIDIHDNINDKKLIKNNRNNNFQPLPSYKQLQNDIEKMKIKVKLFYEGKFEEIENKDEINEENAVPRILPLVDSFERNIVQRRIFLRSIDSVFKLVCPIFNVKIYDLQQFMINLSKTFNLTAKNIVMYSFTLKYIGLITLKLYAKKDLQIEQLLSEKIDKQKAILEDVGRDIEFLDNFVNSLLNLC